MRMHALLLVSSLAFALLLAVAVPSAAQSPGDTTYLYDLSATSRYQEGCFDPCLCPMLAEAGLAGTFTLQHTGTEGGWEIFTVDAIQWTISLPSGVLLQVSGSGSLRIDFAGGSQRLNLGLSLDDSPPESFDSGVVPLTADFPRIEVLVSLHGVYCYDKVFTICAERSLPIADGRQGWGTLKSRFE